MKSRLVESLESSQVLDKGGYKYFVNPLTDGVPRMDPDVLREVTDWILEKGNFDCDVILAPESMGIPLAVPVSLALGIPYTVLRKRSYGLPGETLIDQRTGYSENLMTVNGVRKGERVVLIDDVISTGGTVCAIVDALQNVIGAEVVDIIIPVDKNRGKDVVFERTGIPVKTMVDVRISEGKVVVDSANCSTGLS